MKEPIHMLFGYVPYVGYELAKQLLDKGLIESCDISAWNMKYAIADERIRYYDQEDLRHANYSKYVNIHEIPALSKSILESMLPYESMCLKLGRRGCNFPSVEYESEKRKYHIHLRFWNYIFEKNKINFVYFDEYPHNLPCDYIIYCLAKIKKIPMLMADVAPLENIRVFGKDLNSIGQSIKEYYESLNCKKNITEEDLCEPIKSYYKNKKKNLFSAETSVMDKAYIESARKHVENQYFRIHIGKKAILRVWYYKLKILTKHVSYNEKQCYEKIIRDSYFVNYYKRHLQFTIKEYDKLAEYPNYKEKYIFFALQMTPEATTIPLAGVFSEQYTSIQLIARASEKNNIMVYVKEHFVQPFRDKNVYKMIKSIPNVRLIKSEVSSIELIKHAVGVSTQTGSCILESAIWGIPALVLGQGYIWKGIPNLFEIDNEKYGADIIRRILSGDIKVDKENVLRYFFSIQNTCLPAPFPREWAEDYGEEFYKTITTRVGIIYQYLLNSNKEFFA